MIIGHLINSNLSRGYRYIGFLVEICGLIVVLRESSKVRANIRNKQVYDENSSKHHVVFSMFRKDLLKRNQIGFPFVGNSEDLNEYKVNGKEDD